jgi:hypothetical protein
VGRVREGRTGRSRVGALAQALAEALKEALEVALEAGHVADRPHEAALEALARLKVVAGPKPIR